MGAGQDFLVKLGVQPSTAERLTFVDCDMGRLHNLIKDNEESSGKKEHAMLETKARLKDYEVSSEKADGERGMMSETPTTTIGMSISSPSIAPSVAASLPKIDVRGGSSAKVKRHRTRSKDISPVS